MMSRCDYEFVNFLDELVLYFDFSLFRTEFIRMDGFLDRWMDFLVDGWMVF